MGGRLCGFLGKTRVLAETAVDAARSLRRMPTLSAEAARGRPGTVRLRERSRAVRVLRRIARAVGLPWSCRLAAFTTCRALAREGLPVELCFAVRRARPGERSRGSYVGHVWAVPAGGAGGIRCAGEDGLPLTVRLPAARGGGGSPRMTRGGAPPGWRRG